MKEVSMRIAQAALGFFVAPPVIWSADWAWGLPLIVLTVVIHVLGLGLINQKVAHTSIGALGHRHPTATFVVVLGATTLFATSLHGIEAGIWAAAYRFLGALPDNNSAMLYSLGAITSYGHANLSLEKNWQLLGAIEALNGWLLFGLTTAFLFGMIDKVWLLSGRGGQR
jgi:MFS superfamily sulfate permease-like transporter